MISEDNNLYEFDGFCLDPREGVLRRGDERIALSPKVFETLFYLIRKDGAVASKTELLNAVWPDSFVEEGNLTQNIYTLRKILGRDRDGRQLIETVSRRGYRLAATVRVHSRETPEQWDLTPAAAPRPVLGHNAERDQANVLFFNDMKDSRPLRANGVAAFVEAQKPFVRNSFAARKKSGKIFGLLLAIFAGGVFLAGSGLAMLFFYAAAGPDEKTPAPIEQLRLERLTDSGDVVYPTVSPDGEMVAYVRFEEPGQSVWLRQIAAGSAVRTLPPAAKGYQSLNFSPDGSYLYYRQENGGPVYQVPVLGGAPKKIVDNVWGDFSLSPDGTKLAFVRRAGDRFTLLISAADGSGERALAERTTATRFAEAAPAWTPDGRRLTTVVSSTGEPRPVLISIDAESGAETELQTPRWREIVRLVAMPDGRRLLVSARAANEAASQIWMYDAAEGGARRLTNDLENYYWLSLSKDGRKLVARQQQVVSHIWVMEKGKPETSVRLTAGARRRDGVRGLAWTPDGKIVFASVLDKSADLYTIEPGRAAVPLTESNEFDDTFPSAAPAGGHIFFVSHRSGMRQIWRIETDGRAAKQLTTVDEPNFSAFAPAAAPDGGAVYFIRAGSAPRSIWKVSADGGAPQPVSKLEDATADDFLAVSPDGRWIAYHHVAEDQSGADTARRVGVLSIETGQTVKLFESALRRPVVQWDKNSQGFYFVGETANSSSLWYQPLADGGPEKVLDFPDRIFNFAWSPDGEKLALARGKLAGDAVLLTNLP